MLSGGLNVDNLAEAVATTGATVVDVVRVPGAWEVPPAVSRALARRDVEAVDILLPHDLHLPVAYDETTVERGKRAAKRALLERYQLPGGDAMLRRPLVGMASRMVDQKGLDLLSALGDGLTRLGATFTVLGTGEPRYEGFWTGLAARFRDVVGVRIGFDESLAHLIEAGADLFLMPSRFEPCGLNQMYSQRYGTVPVVRATGGLDDTVVDYRPGRAGGTGFKFAAYSPDALRGALGRALDAYARPGIWKAIQRRGMRKDFSWSKSAGEYVKLYERVASGRRAPGSSHGL